LKSPVRSIRWRRKRRSSRSRSGRASKAAARRRRAIRQYGRPAGRVDARIVGQVDDRTSEIARQHGCHQSGAGRIAQRPRSAVAQANDQMHESLQVAHKRAVRTGTAGQCTMFDKIVHSGMSKDDSAFRRACARKEPRCFVALTEAAIEAGDLTISTNCFDENLVLIPGSNPPRFTSRLTAWADSNWRPFYDRTKSLRPEILTVVCTSRLGFLPTHLSEFSRAPTATLPMTHAIAAMADCSTRKAST
jgi:methyl-accepting chemotaxis protein